jgi:hypothetical protein
VSDGCASQPGRFSTEYFAEGGVGLATKIAYVYDRGDNRQDKCGD